jgi:hypothetical protein
VSRRASLPGASELFRLTSSPALDLPPVTDTVVPQGNGRGAGGGVDKSSRKEQLAESGSAKRGTGRTKHDAKITVYVSGDELLAMEHARLDLRAHHDLIVDRGRLVREAVAVMLADFAQHGEDSVLVQRLRSGGVEAQESGN